jgi:NAD+ diphosphatase
MENLPFADDDLRYCRTIGIYKQKQCLVVQLLDATPLPENFTLVSLRKAYRLISPDLWTIAGRAVQFLHWHNEHRFCGKCGNEMVELQAEPAKKCPHCNFLAYPRLTPAVIMSVTWNNKILLGRAASFPKGMYSPLSGFVEAGEILEDAVRREILEEAGVNVTDIQYVASQPWPFPQSLMLGFTARYHSGEIKVDTTELEDARWFDAESMPEQLPSRMSIARILIDQFLDRKDTATPKRVLD